MAFSHIHVPLAHGKKFSQKSASPGGILSNCLKEMDWMAEELVSASGVNDTLVWFMSLGVFYLNIMKVSIIIF